MANIHMDSLPTLYRRTGTGPGTRYHPVCVGLPWSDATWLSSGVWLIDLRPGSRSFRRLLEADDYPEAPDRVALEQHREAACRAVAELYKRMGPGIKPSPYDVVSAVFDGLKGAVS